MTYLEAILLGIVQGLTEFLPISSSGHLEIVKFFTNTEIGTKESLLFTIVLHLATALSTMVVFRKTIFEILKSLFQWTINDEFLFAIKIIISMIPAVFVGFFFESAIELLFNKNILLVGICLVVTGFLLFWADKKRKGENKISFFYALIIGVSQAIAILPGISRSGATIAVSLVLGIKREKAAQFSFLMVIPLIFGSILKKIQVDDTPLQIENFNRYIIGFITAFVVGLFACKWMTRIVAKSQFFYFYLYCFLAGGGIILFYYLR